MSDQNRVPDSRAHPVPVEPVDPARQYPSETAPVPTAAPSPYQAVPGPEPFAPPVPMAGVPRSRTGPEQTRRVMVFAFGIIQVLVGLRVVLVLMAARSDNAIVATVMDASDYLVAPFRGILQSNLFEGSGIVLDLAAILAFIGWTILELMLFWAIGLFRREQA